MKHLVFILIIAASQAAANDPPKCPDTHFPCGGTICCSKK